jgi:hypothetical protein
MPTSYFANDPETVKQQRMTSGWRKPHVRMLFKRMSALNSSMPGKMAISSAMLRSRPDCLSGDETEPREAYSRALRRPRPSAPVAVADIAPGRQTPRRRGYRWPPRWSCWPTGRRRSARPAGGTTPVSRGNGLGNPYPALGPSPVAAHLGVAPGLVHKHPPPVFYLAAGRREGLRLLRPAPSQPLHS